MFTHNLNLFSLRSMDGQQIIHQIYLKFFKYDIFYHKQLLTNEKTEVF